MSQLKPFAVLGVLLALGLAVAGYLVSQTLYNARAANNVVTVRGLAERDVQADLALWQLTIQTLGADLTETNARAKAKADEVVAFLKEKGLGEDAVSITAVNVADAFANQYNDTARLNKDSRYAITTSLVVRSADIEAVNAAYTSMQELIGRGVLLTHSQVDYQYTALNDIKPEMLKEATQNARAAAQQFADDSGSKVGRIQSASQGFFSIKSRDASLSADQESYESRSTIDKKVRVVITVTYYLE